MLKGGMLLAAFDERRPAGDVDLLARMVSNDVETIAALVREVVAVEVDDGVEWGPHRGGRRKGADDGSTVAEMFVSDLRHFFDLPDDAAGPARRMAERLTLIVRAATAGDAGAEWVSALACDRRPGRRPCGGHLAVRRTDVPPSIAWHCTSCGDEGVISGWERSPYDLRPRNPRPRSASARRVVIPTEIAAALRDLQLVDSDTERLIFRAQASDQGVVVVGDDDDLDELMGYLAEANHEDDRRRQRRLDNAFAILSREIEGPLRR